MLVLLTDEKAEAKKNTARGHFCATECEEYGEFDKLELSMGDLVALFKKGRTALHSHSVFWILMVHATGAT